MVASVEFLGIWFISVTDAAKHPPSRCVLLNSNAGQPHVTVNSNILLTPRSAWYDDKPKILQLNEFPNEENKMNRLSKLRHPSPPLRQGQRHTFENVSDSQAVYLSKSYRSGAPHTYIQQTPRDNLRRTKLAPLCVVMHIA